MNTKRRKGEAGSTKRNGPSYPSGSAEGNSGSSSTHESAGLILAQTQKSETSTKQRLAILPRDREEELRTNHSDSDGKSSGLSLDHILRLSLDLDEVAVRNIERILSVGSKRFARELLDLLESASRAVEQNANLLRVVRHHLGMASGFVPNSSAALDYALPSSDSEKQCEQEERGEATSSAGI